MSAPEDDQSRREPARLAVPHPVPDAASDSARYAAPDATPDTDPGFDIGRLVRFAPTQPAPPTQSKAPCSYAELPSGRIHVRMPQTLHAELKGVAQEYDISLNKLIVYLMTWGIGKTNVPIDRRLRMHRMFRDLNRMA